MMGRVISSYQLNAAQVERFKVGDRVVPIETGAGTWRTAGVWAQDGWYRIPRDIPIPAAATMSIK